MDFTLVECFFLAFSPLVGLIVVGTVVDYFEGAVHD